MNFDKNDYMRMDRWNSIGKSLPWIALIISVTFIISSYIQYCRESDSKVKSITRNVYTIKIDGSRPFLQTIQDIKELNDAET